MNIWLHRVSKHNNMSYRLLEMGYISIGFSDFSNEEFLKHIREGDEVLIPLESKFSIYELVGEPLLLKDVPNLKNILREEFEIKDDKIYVNNEILDIEYVYKCKVVVQNILKKNVPDKELISKMKLAKMNMNITDLKENIEKVIKLHRSYKTYDIHDDIVNHIEYHIENIMGENLNLRKLENLIQWYLKRAGCSDIYIDEKSKSGDVVATFENLKIIIYAQAIYSKGYSSSLQPLDVKKFKKEIDNIDDEYTYIPWIITSAEKFSPEVIKTGKDVGVRLINISEFIKMMIDSGFNNINEAFI